MATATVTRPTEALPSAGSDMRSAQVTDWVTNILSFIESASLKSGNVDSTATDGIMTLDDAQTVTGLKTLNNAAAAAGQIGTGLQVAHIPASGTATANDGVEVLFQGEDDGGNTTTYAEIECKFDSVTDGSERGNLIFKTLYAGIANVVLTLDENGAYFRTGTNGTNNTLRIDSDATESSVIDFYSNGLSAFYLTWDGPNSHFEMGDDVLRIADSSGVVQLRDNSAAAGGVRTAAILVHDPGSGTATDDDGVEMLFRGDDDGGAVTTFGEIECVFTDVSNGSIDSRLDFKTYKANSAADAISMVDGNLGLGVTAFGTNGTNVLGIKADGTVPASSPAGMVQIFADDSSGGISNATLAIRTEEAVASEVLACDSTLNIWVNGTEYHLLMRAV